MSDHLTPNRSDLTGGVKSKTHRLQWVVNGFNGFNGFSLEGYACARARTYTTHLQRIPDKSVKSVNSPVPSCDYGLTASNIWRQIGRQIVGWSA